MDFNNITNTAQDLIKNAQDKVNSNPDVLKNVEQMFKTDINQDGSVNRNDTMQQTQTKDENTDVMDVIPVVDSNIDTIDNRSNEPNVNSNSDEGIMHEKLPELADDDEVIE